MTNQSKKSPLLLIAIGLLLASAIAYGSQFYKKWSFNSSHQTSQSALVVEQENILSQNDVINTNWLRTLNPLVKNVEGRVIWSNSLQKGMMEFVGLPEIAKNQKYQLLIYDLVGKDTKPILSTEFKTVLSKKFLVPFTAKETIKSPFKFELMLDTDGSDISQPLFLAQP